MQRRVAPRAALSGALGLLLVALGVWVTASADASGVATAYESPAGSVQVAHLGPQQTFVVRPGHPAQQLQQQPGELLAVLPALALLLVGCMLLGRPDALDRSCGTVERCARSVRAPPAFCA